MWMSQEQLFVLTDRKKPSLQIKWLIENNFVFKIGADGGPKVLISHVEEIMGIKINISKRRKEPNEKALLQHMGIS